MDFIYAKLNKNISESTDNSLLEEYKKLLDTKVDKTYAEQTYIKDAEADNKTYARKNKQWVAIESNQINIFTGFSEYEVIDTTTADLVQGLDITSLEISDYLPIDSAFYDFQLELTEDGKCFWFCSSKPIISMTSSGLPAAYGLINQTYIQNNNGEQIKFYCYRTESLIANNWNFKIQF